MDDRRRITSGSKWEPKVGYSRAVVARGAVYVSGTVGVEADGSVAPGTYRQAQRALEIIRDALTQTGAGFEHVVRTRIFVTDIAEFDDVARAHAEIFGDIRPATSMVQISRLVDPAFRVEIEVDAIL
jgi:enamine deaminase RidA (YjgF/YER057c/UK114 family)